MDDFELYAKAKKNYCFRKCAWRKKSSTGRPQIFFLIDFSNKVFFLSNAALFFFEKQGVLPFFVRREKNVNSSE